MKKSLHFPTNSCLELPAKVHRICLGDANSCVHSSRKYSTKLAANNDYWATVQSKIQALNIKHLCICFTMRSRSWLIHAQIKRFRCYEQENRIIFWMQFFQEKKTIIFSLFYLNCDFYLHFEITKMYNIISYWATFSLNYSFRYHYHLHYLLLLLK